MFVYEDGLNSKAYRKAEGMGKVIANGDSYTLTVEDADVSDVYDYIYVNKTYNPQEGDIQFDLEATEASIRNSEWFLAATQYLYGEQLDASSESGKKKVEVKFDPSFSPGTPSVVTLNITIIFNVFDDGNGSIVVKIANKLVPVFDVHVQENDDGKAFDVSLDMDIETTATLEAKYANSWSSLDEKGNKLTDIANGLASLVKRITSEKLGSPDAAKPYTFAKWIIPIGTLPICIEDSLGFELGASFAGEVGALATNKFHATFGVVYAGGSLQSYHNVDDVFHFDNVTMAGTAGVKVGLFNEVGISAYGTISIDLGIHAGVYADVAGRLSLSGDDLIALFKNEKSLNIVPAYYFETGVYATLDAVGKIFGFDIKRFTLLNKKFPLYQAGHKYLPMSFSEELEDTIYMQNSYFYVVGWDVNALDIQSIGSAAEARNLAWSEFEYTMGPNLRMQDNVVYATTADEFESYITVTSKVNKDLSKTITIIKNPEGPTTTQAEQVIDKAYPTAGYWKVMLNASKFLGVTLDGTALLDTQYTFEDGLLTINADYIKTLGYGAHNIVFESSKGYLKLVARIINSTAVAVDKTQKVFDKATAGAIVWDMQLQGNDIVSVMEGVSAVNAKYFSYRESMGQFVMLASYFNGKAVGSYTETVTLSNGDEIELEVVVRDTRAAKMNTASYEYVAGSNANLALDIETYENAANVISNVSIDGYAAATDAAVVPAALFDGKAVGSYDGTVTVGGSVLTYTVNVVSSTESLIVPVKKKAFYKSSNEDVVFQAKIPAGANVSIVGAEGGYEIGGSSITVKADFLKAQKGTEWNGNVVCGGSSVKLTVSLVNDVMPALVGANVFGSKDDNAISVTWNLQDVEVGDVVIDGLTAEQYAISKDKLTIYPAGLAYGTNVVTVYTPVNSFGLTVNREGTPAISANCTVNKKEAQVAEYTLDVAHLAFDYVTVDGATILASAYRYNGTTLTLANEFVYNLAEGTYTVHVHLTNDVVIDTTLTVKGDIADVNAIGRGSKAEPYLIYTAEQLAAVATFVNQGNATACYKLMADIDMYGKTLKPIGDKDHPYTGTFYGNGYAISNVTIDEPVKVGDDGYAIGMFGLIGEGGTVKDLRLIGAKVNFAKSGSVSAGIVAGRNAGFIENVTIADGSISAESKSWLDIKNAYFDLGAVVGYNNGGYIRNVNVEANIKGKVKGLNVLGIQIGGRKSLINAGAVVGYFTTTEENKKSVRNIQVTASIACDADNNTINNNGWYGFSDLSEDEIAACVKRVSLFNK